MLGLPQNKSVVENSRFLNGLIARKSFSWTRVFMQLEQIMPPKLHVVSISPELERSTNTDGSAHGGCGNLAGGRGGTGEALGEIAVIPQCTHHRRTRET